MRSLDVDRARVAKQIGHEAVQAARLLVQNLEEGLVILTGDHLLSKACNGVCDDGERVSHFVRDDRGQLADDRELLLLDELLLRGAKLFVRLSQLARSGAEL